MRYLVSLVCVLALAVMGCSDDANGGGGAGGLGGSGGGGGVAGSAAPVITSVRWNWEEDCMVGTSTAVTITVFANDNDTDQLSLVYTGSVSDCSPAEFDGSVTDVSILDCDSESLDLRNGMITVEDPEENSDTVTFDFQPCESGRVCEGGDPCD